MSYHSMGYGVVVAAAGGLLSGCSARSEVTELRPVHASAAQRVELAATADSPATPAEAAVMSVNRQVPSTPEVIRLPDGTVGVKVAQQYFHTIVACRRDDGTFTTQCPTGTDPTP